MTLQVACTLFPLQRDDGGFAVSTSRAHGEFDQWTHERFFPIGSMAYDLFGLICISLSGDDRGHIFDWTHPLDFPDPEEAAKDMYNMSWLAPDFREFWEMLRLMTQDEWYDWGG